MITTLFKPPDEGVVNRHNGCEKRFDQKRSNVWILKALSKNPIGVINWRNGYEKRFDQKRSNVWILKALSPKPYRRDQPAQRLRCNVWILKALSKNPIGVVNRRNGCEKRRKIRKWVGV